MKINVGSKNRNKVQAVQETVLLYPAIFPHALVEGVDVAVETFGHPKNMDEIVSGAIDRARKSFTDCDYSFGLESGLFSVPHTKTGYIEIQACAIFDGAHISLGFSPGFEWPKQAAELIVAGKADGSVALKMIGLTEHEKIGDEGGGAISLLTEGRITRVDQIRSSIIMAMIQLQRPELYS